MSAVYYSSRPGSGTSRIISLGCIYVLLGVLALGFASATTFAAVIALGCVLLAVGVAEIVYGIRGRHHGQLWPHLGFGCLALICGGLVLINPIENTLGFTLITGFLLIATGLAKAIGSVAERSSGWIWYAFNGLVSIFIGGFILATFPMSAIWTIGAFVGVDLVFAGSMLIGLGANAKRAKRELVGEAYSTLNPDPQNAPRTEREQPLH